MDQFDIYVNVERPSCNPGKRRTSVKCSEPALSVPGTGNETSEHLKRSFRAAAVLVGLLCLLLLAGLITMVVLLTNSNSEQEMERALLHTTYNNLTKEKDQLQTSYHNLTNEKDQLQTSYNNLTKEKDQLQTRYNSLARVRAQLQERFERLSKDINELKKKFQGWDYFRGSFYFVSAASATWQQSREKCLQKGADLVIINSKEEQDFLNKFNQHAWIGLTDADKEGTWKWVDGTQVIKSYWGPDEPNGQRDENCGEINIPSIENSWNDVNCDAVHPWICEKKW